MQSSRGRIRGSKLVRQTIRERRVERERGERELYIYFGLPSGFMEVSEVLEEVLPLLLVRDGVLVEDLGHVHGYECARVRAC